MKFAPKHTQLKCAQLILSSLIASLLIVQPAVADEASLQKQVDALSAQLEALKSEIKNLHQATDAIAEQQEKKSTNEKNTANESGASLWGYGEINYNRPKNSAQETQMDLRRAVFGIGYKFNEQTHLVSEYEIEHAIASADDAGEVEVEQFYIDHQLSSATHLKAGLFLIPAGLLNENHEPTHYYGVERNFVETAIIPSTWREGGVGIFGVTESGFAWDLGVTTTVDLNKWDPTSDEGKESPLGSIHQELQLAKAADLGTYAALNYRGIPSFTLGSSIFSSKISQQNDAMNIAQDARMTLWDLHSRWTPNNWDLSAVYAHGSFTNTTELNKTFAGFPTPVPKTFFGAYVQAAYKIWQEGNYSLAPFVRYETVNTAASYEPMPQGLGVDAAQTEHISTVGASFYLNPQVVFKMDIQQFKNDSDKNRINLGLGLAF